MIYPYLDNMMKYIKNKYILVVLSAQRAIQLTKGEKKLIETMDDKPITVALEEIAEGKIKYHLK